MMKPIRMLAHPWMVGRALDCKIEGDFNSETVGRRVEAIEITERADRRIDRGMAACLTANRPRAARRVRSPVQRIAGTFAIGVPNRMNWRQVYDVEAEVSKLGQPTLDIME